MIRLAKISPLKTMAAALAMVLATISLVLVAQKPAQAQDTPACEGMCLSLTHDPGVRVRGE